MTELRTGGGSDKTKRGLVDAKKVFESFRTSSDALKEQYPDPFEKLGVDILADPKVYSQLAHYMLHEYEKKGGGQLDDTTIMPYLRRLINAAKDRFKPGGSAEVLLFFTCVEKCAPPHCTRAPEPLWPPVAQPCTFSYLVCPPKAPPAAPGHMGVTDHTREYWVLCTWV